MEKLIFPDLYCPFPSQINKHVDVLEGYALEWVTRLNLLKDELSYKRFRKSKFYLLAASTYPSCQLEELKIANDWICWLFLWDDQCDMSDLGKQPKMLEIFQNRFLEILHGAELTSNDIPLGRALFDLRKRLLQIGSTKSFKNFIRTVEKYFDGSVMEANNRRQGTVPNMENCAEIHMLSGAVDSVLELIVICNHLNIPHVLRENETLTEIRRITNNIICWSNDIYSLYREMESGDVHNLVLALYYHQQLPLEAAMQIVADMHDQELRTMLILEKSLTSFEVELDTNLEKYISGLHAWISGNYNWSFQGGRYNNLESLELVKS